MSCRGRLGRSIRTGRSVKGMAHPLAILPPMVDDLARTEDELLRAVRAEGDFLTEIASHLIKAGGKRVRPGSRWRRPLSSIPPDRQPRST